MKKWLKWILGIFGVLILAIVVFVIWNWETFRIVSGTEGLNGESGKIPAPMVLDIDTVQYGETDWVSWYGPNGDRISNQEGLITDWSKGLNRVWEVDYLCQGKQAATCMPSTKRCRIF